MSIPSLRKVIPHRYEWLVPAEDPWGTPRAQRYESALSAARTAYREAYGLLDDSEDLPKDALCIEKSGADVLISFTVDEPAPLPPAPRKGQ